MCGGIQSRCRAEPATVLDVVRWARFVDERRMGFARGPRFAARKVIQHFFFGTFKRYNWFSKAACETSNPCRNPKKIDPQIA